MVDITGASIFKTLGKGHKLALARRDKHVIDQILKQGGEWIYDRVIIDDLLVKCDKYAANNRSKK